MKHPFTHALYEQDGNGNVKVTRTDGTWGLFRSDGRWVRGEVRECDAQMCNWIAGPQFVNARIAQPVGEA
jgi:hypothetical protein